jgi:hypothetical protein
MSSARHADGSTEVSVVIGSAHPLEDLLEVVIIAQPLEGGVAGGARAVPESEVDGPPQRVDGGAALAGTRLKRR